MAQRGRSAAAGARLAAWTPVPGHAPDRAAAMPPLRPQELAALRSRVRQLVEPIVAAQGLDLEGLSVARAGRRYVLRVIVDGDGGVGHDELSDVSQEISAALDEAEQTGEEFTPDSYTLEVSSPGIDRPLTLPRHWRRNVGRMVKVKAEQSQVTGRILAVSETTVSLDLDGERREFAFADLGPGHVQVEFREPAGGFGEVGDDGDPDEELEDEA